MYTVNNKLRSWASDIDEGTIRQAEKTSRLPILAGPVALMPDAHVGIGATVGSVVATEGAIIPSAVGVDIGCGMIAVKTDLGAHELPDDLAPLISEFEEVVPAGVGKGHERISRQAQVWFDLNQPASKLTTKQSKTALEQFGSLGSGNHFAEICLDEVDDVWVVLHSGSRGIGNQLASGHIRIARTAAKGMHLEDPDLAWFIQGTPEFDNYIRDLRWAQDYALGNREVMMDNALRAFFGFVGHGRQVERINCHHNYAALEEHDGRTVWVTRKGAIRATTADRGVIPGSMGTRSYIVEGLGNPLSYNSCSHGAGRRMSRGEAKRRFSSVDLIAQMGDRTWQADKAGSLIDEIPTSYKDIDVVMEDQKDLVRIAHTLHQVFNYKGTG